MVVAVTSKHIIIVRRDDGTLVNKSEFLEDIKETQTKRDNFDGAHLMR